MSGMFEQLSPLLLGAQVGTVLGFLGQRVMGQYDIAIPRSGPGSLLFVVSNIAQFERDWSLDPTDFRTFIAMHEVTHRFEFARPWARERVGRAAPRLPVDAEDRRGRHAGAPVRARRLGSGGDAVADGVRRGIVRRGARRRTADQARKDPGVHGSSRATATT